MSYTPTTWVTGDIVTADKLNKLENGVASGTSSGALIVILPNEYGGTTDKTAGEVIDAINNGGTVIFKKEEEQAESTYFKFEPLTNLEYYEYDGEISSIAASTYNNGFQASSLDEGFMYSD